MSPLSDFRQGDRVTHFFCGAGIVDAVDNGVVKVIFDTKGKSGNPWRGEYDELWFRLHPDGLTKSCPPLSPQSGE